MTFLEIIVDNLWAVILVVLLIGVASYFGYKSWKKEDAYKRKYGYLAWRYTGMVNIFPEAVAAGVVSAPRGFDGDPWATSILNGEITGGAQGHSQDETAYGQSIHEESLA